MKKGHVFILTIILTPLLAGTYGIVHDQFTYTISAEYFTKFKFPQFGLAPADAVIPHPRLFVAFVGFLATWWTGILIGPVQALVGLKHPDAKSMAKAIIQATKITIGVTLITGLIGLCYGKLYLSRVGVDWWLPDNLQDKAAFITVGSMHNFSYLGGAIGLIAGVWYQYRVIKKDRKHKISTAIN